jgi:peptidyl-tRNA hydrolase
LTNYFHEDEEDLEEEEEELCQQSRSTKINSHNGEVYTIEDSDDDTETDSDDFDEEDIPEFKMVFVVNMSLEMGPGKIAAQVGHAALGVQRVLSSKAKSGKYKLSTTDLGLWQDFGISFTNFIPANFCENMVVVQGESTQHLKDLHLMAEDLELPSFLIKDAGITQVPSGAVTVFGVFGEDEDVNKITGRLKHL